VKQRDDDPGGAEDNEGFFVEREIERGFHAGSLSDRWISGAARFDKAHVSLRPS
jgi:hypothetical protein